MKVLYSLIFDIITDPLGLPVSWGWEFLILIGIEAFAGRIAWDTSPGGLFGSEIHWFVKILAFIVIWAIIYAVILTVKLIVAHWVTVICILGGILLITAIITFVVRRKLNSF